MIAIGIPANYAEWRHCIEQQCRQPLTPDFIAARLTRLRDSADLHTREFTRLYGEPHLRATLGWFERAQFESLPRN